jgi:CDP-glucose 4,6-dehydratase
MIERAFWRDRRVLLTGHTGFKGAWLSLWLEQMGATVFGPTEIAGASMDEALP